MGFRWTFLDILCNDGKFLLGWQSWVWTFNVRSQQPRNEAELPRTNTFNTLVQGSCCHLWHLDALMEIEDAMSMPWCQWISCWEPHGTRGWKCWRRLTAPSAQAEHVEAQWILETWWDLTPDVKWIGMVKIVHPSSSHGKALASERDQTRRLVTRLIIIIIIIIIIIMIMSYREGGGSSGFCCPAVSFAVIQVSWGWLAFLLCPSSCFAVLLARVWFLALNCAGASLAVLFCSVGLCLVGVFFLSHMMWTLNHPLLSGLAHDKKHSKTLKHQQSWALTPPSPQKPKR